MSSEHAPAASHTKSYVAVFVTLMVLTIATVAASELGNAKHGDWSRTTVILVGLAIALVKATCVGLIFMHLLREKKIFFAVALFPFLLVTILITFTLGDLDRWIYMLVPG